MSTIRAERIKPNVIARRSLKHIPPGKGAFIVMTTKSISVHLFKNSYKPFTDLLVQNGVTFEERHPPAGVIMNAGETVEILNALQIPSIAASLATVICAFVRARSSRKIIITLKDNQIVHAEGYSEKEIQSILSNVKNITAIETENV